MSRLDEIRQTLDLTADWDYVTLPQDHVRALLALAEAAAALPWTERGMLIQVDDLPGLSGPTKDPRFRRLQKALDALEKGGQG